MEQDDDGSMINTIVERMHVFWMSNISRWMKFASVSEEDIVKIFNPSQEPYVSQLLNHLTMNHELPFHCKMILRYRERLNGCMMNFYMGCDPSNQRKLLRFVGFTSDQWSRAHDMCHLLSYYSYYVVKMTRNAALEGVYYIDACGEEHENLHMIPIWSSYSEEKQLKMYTEYVQANMEFVKAFINVSC